MNTYVFRAELVEEDDGRWSAGVPALAGCATGGGSREEALWNLRDAVEAYVRDMRWKPTCGTCRRRVRMFPAMPPSR